MTQDSEDRIPDEVETRSTNGLDDTARIDIEKQQLELEKQHLELNKIKQQLELEKKQLELDYQERDEAIRRSKLREQEDFLREKIAYKRYKMELDEYESNKMDYTRLGSFVLGAILTGLGIADIVFDPFKIAAQPLIAFGLVFVALSREKKPQRN